VARFDLIVPAKREPVRILTGSRVVRPSRHSDAKRKNPGPAGYGEAGTRQRTLVVAVTVLPEQSNPPTPSSSASHGDSSFVRMTVG